MNSVTEKELREKIDHLLGIISMIEDIDPELVYSVKQKYFENLST